MVSHESQDQKKEGWRVPKAAIGIVGAMEEGTMEGRHRCLGEKSKKRGKRTQVPYLHKCDSLEKKEC